MSRKNNVKFTPEVRQVQRGLVFASLNPNAQKRLKELLNGRLVESLSDTEHARIAAELIKKARS